MKLKNKICSAINTFIEKTSHPLLTAAGTITLSLGCAFVGNYDHSKAWSAVDTAAKFIAYFLTQPYIGIILGAFILLLNEYGRHNKTRKIEVNNENLKKENEQISTLKTQINGHQEAIQNYNGQILKLQLEVTTLWLKQVSKLFNLNSRERASIYFELNGEFSIMARYSSNPSLKVIHKQKFPLDIGIISHAWRHGRCVEMDCPEHAKNPSDYYQYMSNKYQYNEKELEKFHMKSCWYTAVAINKADDNMGIILFESENSNFLSKEETEKLIQHCQINQSHLVNFIEESKALEVAKRMDSAKDSSQNDAEILHTLGGIA